MAPLLARKPAADRQFERIYQRHVADVYRYVLVVLRNPADAEDVTQTTFMNAYRAFQRGERPDTPKNWLIAIAHNVCRQRFRQQQRRPNEVEFFEEAAEAAVVENENEFSAEDIQRAIGQLAFNQRAALVMRELEGRSYGEIAEIMGLSLSAVETLIFRARRALREQLEGSLTCSQAELALSKQTDGVLSRQERGQLRAHLRECKECESLARRSRASRGALKALFVGIPLPGSLASFFGGGGGVAAVGLGAGAAAKVGAVVFAGAVLGSAGYEGSKQLRAHPVAAPRGARASAVAVTHAASQSPVAASAAPARPRRGEAAVSRRGAAAVHAAKRHAAAVAAQAKARADETRKRARTVGQARRPKVAHPTPVARPQNDVKSTRPRRSENDVARARPVKGSGQRVHAQRVRPPRRAKPARPVEQGAPRQAVPPAAARPTHDPVHEKQPKPEPAVSTAAAATTTVETVATTTVDAALAQGSRTKPRK